MTKSEILKNLKEKQVDLCNEFITFVRNEDFIETVDKVGNFSTEMPLFYKKVSENVFLAFNIQTFNNIKKYGFCADFWKVLAKSESEFLISKLENENLIDLRLGFTLERDLNLYKNELTKN